MTYSKLEPIWPFCCFYNKFVLSVKKVSNTSTWTHGFWICQMVQNLDVADAQHQPGVELLCFFRCKQEWLGFINFDDLEKCFNRFLIPREDFKNSPCSHLIKIMILPKYFVHVRNNSPCKLAGDNVESPNWELSEAGQAVGDFPLPLVVTWK